MGKVKRSPWLLHYDASSCNGCDIEVLACMTPVYDVERFGVVNTADPMQADILLVTGGVNSQSAEVVKQLYDQMARPKVVVAVGICACTGGVFKDCYNINGGVDTVIPVDVYVPGCAARPESIIDGVVKAVQIFQERSDAHYKYVKEHGESERNLNDPDAAAREVNPADFFDAITKTSEASRNKEAEKKLARNSPRRKPSASSRRTACSARSWR